MSYQLEFNRFIFREQQLIFLFRKVGQYIGTGDRIHDWELTVFDNVRDFWTHVCMSIVETQKGQLKRATGWNNVQPFTAVDYASLYTQKLKNAKNFDEMLTKFRLLVPKRNFPVHADLDSFMRYGTNTYALTTREEIFCWYALCKNSTLDLGTYPANYFTNRGSI